MLQIIKSVCLADYEGNYGKSRLEVILNENQQITYNQMLFQEGYTKLQPIMYSTKENVQVEGCLQSTVIGTTANKVELERLQMVEGAFFDEQANYEEKNIAVMSDQLAIKLWGSEKAVKNVLKIGNDLYQVVGVYKKYESLRDYRLDDGSEKIYVPLNSSIAKGWGIKEIIINGSNKKELPRIQELATLGIESGQSLINDKTHWMKQMTHLSTLPIVLLWACFNLILIKVLMAAIKDRKQLVRYKLLKVVSGVVISYFIYKVSFAGKLYIEPSSLPGDNIFDVSFYWKALQQEWITHNQFISNKFSNFEQAYFSLKSLVHSLNLIQIVILVKGVFLWRKEHWDLK